MQDYYKNLTCNDLNEVLNLNSLFIYWDTYYNDETKDLYFVGIKKDDNHIFNINLPEYQNKGVIKTTLNMKNIILLIIASEDNKCYNEMDDIKIKLNFKY